MKQEFASKIIDCLLPLIGKGIKIHMILTKEKVLDEQGNLYSCAVQCHFSCDLEKCLSSFSKNYHIYDAVHWNFE